jgi:hypothetical protein
VCRSAKFAFEDGFCELKTMKFRIADDRLQPHDVIVELELSAIVVLSRGGMSGSGQLRPNAR